MLREDVVCCWALLGDVSFSGRASPFFICFGCQKNRRHRNIITYAQGYESASKRAFVISIAFGLMSQPIKFRFNSLQTTAVVPEPK